MGLRPGLRLLFVRTGIQLPAASLPLRAAAKEFWPPLGVPG